MGAKRIIFDPPGALGAGPFVSFVRFVVKIFRLGRRKHVPTHTFPQGEDRHSGRGRVCCATREFSAGRASTILIGDEFPHAKDVA
jgi:hypothetical protein